MDRNDRRNFVVVIDHFHSRKNILEKQEWMILKCSVLLLYFEKAFSFLFGKLYIVPTLVIVPPVLHLYTVNQQWKGIAMQKTGKPNFTITGIPGLINYTIHRIK